MLRLPLTSLGAFHAPRPPLFLYARSCLHGVGERRARQGQRDDRHGARAARARPTAAPAAAIGEVTHYNIFEGLTKINEDFSVTPLLAEKWDFSPDLKTLTFTLKPNIKFQDDEPFSSKDVKYSFERYAAKDSTNKDKAFFASIESIDTPDPMTVVLKFKQPSFEALFHLGMDTAVILDEKSATAEATNPVGTGPYKLSSWAKGSSITLDKWDGYRDAAKIPLAHATFRFISDPSAAVAAMLAGDVDAFPRFANNQALDQFKSDPRFQVLVGGTEGKTILAMNNKKKPLDDVRVRQAIAYAIDRKAIIDGAQNGLGAPIGSHLTPNDPGYVDLTGHVSARSREGEGAAEGSGRHDAARAQPHPAAAALRASGRRDHRRSSSPRSGSTPRSRTSNGRSG